MAARTPTTLKAVSRRALAEALSPSEPAGPAARRLLQNELSLASDLLEPALADQGVEALHDYRVSLRRSRSLLGVMKGVVAADERRRWTRTLKALAEPTGAVRDLDVLLAARATHLAWLPKVLVPGGETAFQLLGARRSAERQALAMKAQQQGWASTLETGVTELDGARAWERDPKSLQPLVEVAGRVVRARYRSVRKRAAGLQTSSPEADVHALRIACKKLRYALDFFLPVLGRPAALRKLRRTLKGVQSQLGDFNDHCVQRSLWLAQLATPDEPLAVVALGAFVGGHGARLQARRPLSADAAIALCDPRSVRNVHRALR